MRIAVYVLSAFLVVAAGYVVVSFHGGLSSLFDLLMAQPIGQRAAWIALTFAMAGILVFALWQSDMVAQQRKAIDTLEKRTALHALDHGQGDIDKASAYLVESDPGEASGMMQQRVLDAAHIVTLQESRNDSPEFDRRVEEIRSQQNALRERLGGVVAKRRAIDQILAELGREQQGLERSLGELDRDDEKKDFKGRIRDLTEFVGDTRARLNEIERALVTLDELRNGFADLHARLARLEAPQGGVKELATEVRNLNDRLTACVAALETDNDVLLKERVQRLSASKQDLDRRLASLNEDFVSLGSLHKGISSLFARLSETLGAHMPS
jgi:chromosome segregation ATPase